MRHADVFYHSTEGLRLYARDYFGPVETSPAILCLPGLTRNSKDFAALAEHLCKRFRVICPDQRGRGRSERDVEPLRYRPDVYVADMWTLCDVLRLPSVAIIGTSLGGLMAILMAAQAPERVDRIVTNDIGPEVDPKGIARIAGYVGKSAPVETWEQAARQTAQINAVAFPDYTDADWMAMATNTYIQEDAVPVLDYDPAIAHGLSSGSATPDLMADIRRTCAQTGACDPRSAVGPAFGADIRGDVAAATQPAACKRSRPWSRTDACRARSPRGNR